MGVYYTPDEAIETPETIEFLRMADFRCIQGIAKKPQRLVISLQRHRMRVAVLAAMRKCKPRGIVEPTGRAVNHFRNECERLERAWAELLQ